MATISPRDFLTKGQLSALEAVERTMSVISLLATMFIFGTFVTFDFFRKPRNRLVFWASLGNAMTNIATLISTSGFVAGPKSALCQFQGFLIQMFMPADTLWTLCMALNVYFTFFRNYNAADLRKLEKWYLLLCYGATLVPALIYLILDHTADTGIYGPALIWCWISVKWEWMRVAFFYGPVWICILATMSIYIWTGRNVLKQRAVLRAFSEDRCTHLSPPDNPADPLDLANVTRITEITITTEALRSASRTNILPRPGSVGSLSTPRKLSSPNIATPPRSDKGTQVLRASMMPLQRPLTKQFATSSPTATCTATVTTGSSSVTDSTDTAEGYTANHLPPKCYRQTVNNANRATIGYAKVAVPMFVAMLIVWVPSTINRVYSLVHYPGVHTSHPNFTLNLIAALVLPTQGFWNAVIYIITSWSQCRAAWRQIRYGERPSDVHYLNRKRSNTSDATPGSSAQPLRSGSFSLDGSSCNRPTKPRENREMSLLEAMAMSPEDEMDFDVDVERAIPACVRPKGRGLAMGQRYVPHKAVGGPSVLSTANRSSEEDEVDDEKRRGESGP